MLRRFLGCAPILALVVGCGSRAVEMAAEAPSTASPPQEPSAMSLGNARDASPEVRTASMQSLASESEGSDDSAPPPPAPSAEESAPVQPAPARPVTAEMLDLEARIAVTVENARRAAAELRRQVERDGGTITAEALLGGDDVGTVSMTLRVPAGKSNGVLSAIQRLGEVETQEVTARDVGKEYFDAGLRLANLEVTLVRYQKILERATTVQEVLQIEDQLTRVRGEIEQVKGNLRYLSDRVARATIYVTLRSAEASAPEALFYPGVRATYILDLRGSDGEHGYFGGGVSLRLARALSFELDALRGFDSDAHGLDGVLATVGGDVYSSLLGGGKRRTFNPYLGYRLGYARLPDTEDAFVFGGVLGLEVLKTQLLTLDADVGGLGFVGDHRAHFGAQAALGLNVAF